MNSLADLEALDVITIIDTPQNINLLMKSDALIELKLLAGKAQKVLDLHKNFTGWYRREIASDGICESIGGGVLLFKTNPLVIKRIDSKGKSSTYVEAFTHAFAIDNAIK